MNAKNRIAAEQKWNFFFQKSSSAFIIICFLFSVLYILWYFLVHLSSFPLCPILEWYSWSFTFGDVIITFVWLGRWCLMMMAMMSVDTLVSTDIIAGIVSRQYVCKVPQRLNHKTQCMWFQVTTKACKSDFILKSDLHEIWHVAKGCLQASGFSMIDVKLWCKVLRRQTNKHNHPHGGWCAN